MARRQLRYVAHESQALHVDLRTQCLDVPCDDPTTTCVKGRCVPATIPGDCVGGCTEAALELAPPSTADVASSVVRGPCNQGTWCACSSASFCVDFGSDRGANFGFNETALFDNNAGRLTLVSAGASAPSSLVAETGGGISAACIGQSDARWASGISCSMQVQLEVSADPKATDVSFLSFVRDRYLVDLQVDKEGRLSISTPRQVLLGQVLTIPTSGSAWPKVTRSISFEGDGLLDVDGRSVPFTLPPGAAAGRGQTPTVFVGRRASSPQLTQPWRIRYDNIECSPWPQPR